MSNRVPRRQGVIYGPPRFSPEDGGNNALVGRVLGLGMVGMALLVLVGAVVLVNRPPGATPTRHIGPTASPTPGSPSPLPSATITPVPATPILSPTPSPFAVKVQTGPGYVTFGTGLNSDRTIADPRATFVPSDRISWSGQMTEAVDSADVRVRLFILDDSAPNGERLLSEGAAQPKGTAQTFFTRDRLSPAHALDGPGIYLVRYVKGEQVLAEGYFQLDE